MFVFIHIKKKIPTKLQEKKQDNLDRNSKKKILARVPHQNAIFIFVQIQKKKIHTKFFKKQNFLNIKSKIFCAGVPHDNAIFFFMQIKKKIPTKYEEKIRISQCKIQKMLIRGSPHLCQFNFL